LLLTTGWVGHDVYQAGLKVVACPEQLMGLFTPLVYRMEKIQAVGSIAYQ